MLDQHVKIFALIVDRMQGYSGLEQNSAVGSWFKLLVC